jgi:hypothetical protein
VFHVDGQTDTIKLTVAFRKFAKAPEMAALLTGRLHGSLFRRHLSKNDSVQHRLHKSPTLHKKLHRLHPTATPFAVVPIPFKKPFDEKFLAVLILSRYPAHQSQTELPLLKITNPTLSPSILIQCNSGGICETSGNDSMCDSKQKRSYKHVSDFRRLRSYGHFLIPVHALM